MAVQARSPQAAFLAVLENTGKGRRGSSEAVRTRGFVVLARNATSLAVVQEWCMQQSWNPECVAARYRIDSGPVFGTLFAALIDDLDRVVLHSPEKLDVSRIQSDLNGSFLTRTRASATQSILEGLAAEPRPTKEVKGWFGAGKGTLPSAKVDALLDLLARRAAFAVGHRLVLLAEVEGDPDPEEWETTGRKLFARLPERVGLVLTGAPEEFSLPAGDPHYLELDLAGIEPSSPPEDANVYELAALSSDRPTSEDHLGLRRFAEALAQFILHPETKPLTIAVQGPWGKGKSSFMQLVRLSLLEEAIPRDHGPLPPSGLVLGIDGRLRRPEGMDSVRWRRTLRALRERVVTVDFNAWRYQDSTQVWAGLASTTTSGIEAALPRRRRLLTPFAYAWRNHRADLLVDVVLPAILAALILTLAALGIPELQDVLDRELASDALARLLGTILPGVASLVAGFWLLAARARRVIGPISERVRTYIRRPDYRDQMGYQHRVLDDLRFVVRRLRKDRDDPRIVVFIDDLDRCSDDKVMEILQAINLILGESECYVVLGIDTGMIHRAIEAHYAASGRPLDRAFARTYLEKIVQLPFHLPTSSREQRDAFVAGLFSDAARLDDPEPENGAPDGAGGPPPLDWNLDKLEPPEVHNPKPVPDTPAEVQAFLDFYDCLDDNPREIKRLVNIHRFVKIVLQKQGRLPPEDMQRKLVKWLLFCARWPAHHERALAYARTHPGSSDDCIAQVARDDPLAKEFAGRASDLDVLTAGDLAPDGPLALAASISRSVYWRSLDEREPQPAASASTDGLGG